MIKIILCIVICQIYAAFMQDRDYLYTLTDGNEEWSSKSMSSRSRMKRFSEMEKRIMIFDCYHTVFYSKTNMTRNEILACINLLVETSQILDAISIDASNEEFSVNTTHLKILSRNGTLTEDDFEVVSFLLKVIAYRVSTKILEDIVNIVSDAIDMGHYSFRLREAFIDLLHNLNTTNSHLAVIAPKLVVAVWHPFLSNFTGILWTKTMSDNTESRIEKINCASYYRLSQFNVNRTEMWACVHPSFLKELAISLTEKERKKLYVVLILSMDNLFFGEHTNAYSIYDNAYRWLKSIRVVGFSIPGYCKENYEPLLNISFDGRLNYIFGEQYFDPSYIWHRYTPCILSEMVFMDMVHTTHDTVVYYESVREYYCLGEAMTESIEKVRWIQTKLFKDGYPDSFCIDGNYTIPSRWCSRSGFEVYSHIECSQNHELSPYSKKFYDYATKCNRFKNFIMILENFNSTILNKLDQHLYLMTLDCISNDILSLTSDTINTQMQQNLNMVHATVSKGIDIAHKLNKSHLINNFMYQFLFSTKNDWIKEGIEIYPSYILFKHKHSPFKMIISKGDGNSFSNYRARISTEDINTTVDYIPDAKTEVVIIIKPGVIDYKLRPIVILVLYSNVFSTLKSFILRSRVVFIYHDNLDAKIKFYFKIINFNDNQIMISHTGEGHWIDYPDNPYVLTRTAIYEEYDNNCVREKFAIISDHLKNEVLKTEKLVEEPIDLLSAVSFSINTADTVGEIEEIYRKYLFTFSILRLAGGTLSCIGAFLILATTLMLKSWYKTRFNIIQLTITLAIQLPFFLLNTEVSHVKILIFYYCVLCQFSCTSIIGYVQYTKYIAVFKNGTIGRLRSLIIGWVIPLTIILSSLFFYGGCLKCHLCHKNKEIFMFFVFVPIVTIIVGNSIVYIVAMINIWSSPKLGSHDIRLKIKVSIFLPCVLGITWIFIAALVAPWSWLPLLGLFLIHLVLPSQGFLLFIFVILLDKVTRDQWKNYLSSIRRKRINPAIELN